MKDHSLLFRLRVPTRDGLVIIRAYDGGPNISGGDRIDVEVILKGETIFKRGDTWCGTPACGGMSLDGDEAKELVMSLVAMKPGDTDEEYFSNYNACQRSFAESLGEEIGMVRMDRYCDPETGEPRRVRR